MTLPAAWMMQAQSDFRTAQFIDNPHQPTSRCQAISKYQQAVEKSIKGVLDKMHEARLVAVRSDSKHHVARYAAVLSGFPATGHSRDLLKQLQRLFSNHVVEQMQLLDSLVPPFPRGGALAQRNHEYPFQDLRGNWHAPTEETTFTVGEMKRIRNCAGLLIKRLSETLEALELLFP